MASVNTETSRIIRSSWPLAAPHNRKIVAPRQFLSTVLSEFWITLRGLKKLPHPPQVLCGKTLERWACGCGCNRLVKLFLLPITRNSGLLCSEMKVLGRSVAQAVVIGLRIGQACASRMGGTARHRGEGSSPKSSVNAKRSDGVHAANSRTFTPAARRILR